MGRMLLLIVAGAAGFLAGQAPDPPMPTAPLITPTAPPPPEVDPPRLLVEPSGRVDLGVLGPRQVATRQYTFRNVSPKPIQLRVLDLSPGVVVKGSALEAPIHPGGIALLELTADPSGFVGVQRRNVRLGTDDPRQGHYYLPVSMTVRPDLVVDAQKKGFGTCAPHESPQVTFSFRRETGEPAVLKLVSELPPYLEAEVHASGPSAELQLTFHPDQVEPGTLLGLEALKVETNAPLQPVFELYVDWKIEHPIEALPVRVVILDPTATERELRLNARDGKPFTIRKAAVQGAGFRLGPVPTTAAPAHTLTVIRTAPQSARALLVLEVADLPPLKVPLAFLPPAPPPKPDAKTPAP